MVTAQETGADMGTVVAPQGEATVARGRNPFGEHVLRRSAEGRLQVVLPGETMIRIEVLKICGRTELELCWTR
jgi:hypothetical protein